MNALHMASSRTWQDIRSAINNVQNGCIEFSNEHHVDCYSPARLNESPDQYSVRLLVDTAAWYYLHLKEAIPSIVLVDTAPCLLPTGVRAMSLGHYLQEFHADDIELLEQYTSLVEAVAAEASCEDTESDIRGGVRPGQTPFTAYKSPDVLEAGLKSGLYVQGTLKVNKYRSATEAFVRAGKNASCKVV